MRSLVAVARTHSNVRETEGPNKGPEIRVFQHFTGNTDGESWCCSFVCYCLHEAGSTTFAKSGACQDIYAQAKAKGLVIAKPEVGCLFVYVTDADHAHHIGIITSVSPLTGIAGNTSEDGKSSNGTGVFEHALNVNPNHIRFIKVPV